MKIYGLDVIDNQENDIVSLYKWDNLTKLPDFDTIIHLAGKAHVTEDKSKYQEYFDVNTGLTQKIFDHFLESKAKKFIFFSTVKAVADSIEDKILTEEVVPNPIGPYAESKKKAEDYILSKLDEVNKTGKYVYIIRPCLIHGPGNKGNLNLLYNVVKKGIPWPLGAYDNKRSFCSIENITFVVEKLIESENIPSGIYNMCDDEPLSTNEIIKLISLSTNKKNIIWNIPKNLINVIAKIAGVLLLPFNESRLKKLTENYLVSNKKMKTVLGIQELPVTATEGMIKTLESFK